MDCSRCRSIHVLLKRGLVDWEFLIRYTNAPWLVVQTPGMPGDGLFARDADGNPLVWDQDVQRLVNGNLPGHRRRAATRRVELPDGRRAKSVFALVTERYLDERYSPERVSAECGVPAATITRIALRDGARRVPARRSSCRSAGPTCTGARTTR